VNDTFDLRSYCRNEALGIEQHDVESSKTNFSGHNVILKLIVSLRQVNRLGLERNSLQNGVSATSKHSKVWFHL